MICPLTAGWTLYQLSGRPYARHRETGAELALAAVETGAIETGAIEDWHRLIEEWVADHEHLDKPEKKGGEPDPFHTQMLQGARAALEELRPRLPRRSK